LVSTARMTPLDVPPDPFFQVWERSGLRWPGEDRVVDLLGCMTACPSYNNLTAFIVPFQNRTWANSQFLADLRRNRDLALRGELRVSQSHKLDYHGNARRQLRAGISRCPTER
jgi:hypothetical protein